MGRFSAPIAALCLAAAAVLGLSACGGSSADLLPGKTADQINSNLDQVRTLVTEGDCAGAEDAVSEVSGEVEELADVDAKLKAALREGTSRLAAVVSHCEEESATVVAAKEKEAEQDEAEAVEAEEEQRAAEAGEEAERDEEAAEKEKKSKGKQGAEEAPDKAAEEPAEEAPAGNEGAEKGKVPPAEAPSGEPSSAGGIGPGVGVE